MRYPGLAAIFPAPTGCSARPPTSSASRAEGRRPAAVAAARRLAGRPASRCAAISTSRARTASPAQADYPFVRVEGDGVHEIPVGPVHAGIIEPGHFRFSVVGEKVLRLEERLGYTHKGIERALRGAAACSRAAARRRASPATRPSRSRGPTAQALEAIAGVEARRAPRGCARCCSSASASPTTSATSARSATTRGFAFGLAQFSRLKEDVLRANAERRSATAY